jgi:hypothetical protein
MLSFKKNKDENRTFANVYSPFSAKNRRGGSTALIAIIRSFVVD